MQQHLIAYNNDSLQNEKCAKMFKKTFTEIFSF